MTTQTSAAPRLNVLCRLAAVGLLVSFTSACHISSPGESASESAHEIPDFSGYASVDWQQFASDGSPGNGYLVRFSTPDGSTRCSILNGLSASCVGNIVGMPNSAPDYSRDRDTFAGNDSGSCSGVLHDISDSQTPQYAFRKNGGGCPPFADTKTLGTGQKLVKYQMTCALGEGSLTACINTATNHGFVLRPSGSWTF